MAIADMTPTSETILVAANELASMNVYADLMAKFGITRVVFLESQAALAAKVQAIFDNGRLAGLKLWR